MPEPLQSGTTPNGGERHLVVVNGKYAGQKVLLPSRVVLIGRDRPCHLRLASLLVSRRHCALAPTPTGLDACDLGSLNGTFVNGLRVRGTLGLKDGDELQVGPVRFRLRIPRKWYWGKPPDAAGEDSAWLMAAVSPQAREALDKLGETVLAAIDFGEGDALAVVEDKLAEVDIVAGDLWTVASSLPRDNGA